jgi:cysteinyl-tRNA synthetase
MNDDFNSAQGIAVLFEHGKEIRKQVTTGKSPSNLNEVKALLKSIADGVIGIWPTNDGGNSNLTGGLVDLLIDIRKDARVNKDFALSDKIRDDLKAIGVQLKDGKDGTTYELE